MGAAIRNQVGALVGGFAWLFVIEPLLTAIPKVGDAIERYGLGGLIDGLDGSAGRAGPTRSGRSAPALVLAGLRRPRGGARRRAAAAVAT